VSRLKSIDAVLEALLEANPPRAGSMIITLFGDSISQHGNAVWLGSIIDALAPFGLNGRQIRTAVFRLVKDDWLSCIRIGRRSYYSFTEFGRRQYEKSARRIYAAAPGTWDGQWTLVIPAYADNERRDQLKRELSWAGFGALANGVLAHPSANQESLAETLQELDLRDQVVVLSAAPAGSRSHEVLKRLTHQSWQLDEYERRFESFIASFGPALEALAAKAAPDPAQMFELQTLLIHEYRRILLKSTDLPDELLPANWSGAAARDLTAGLYRLTSAPSAVHVEAHLEGPKGALPPASDTYRARFAGG